MLTVAARNPKLVQSRIEGVVFGTAIGDALGWPVEFLSMAEITARYGPHGVQDFEARKWAGSAWDRFMDDSVPLPSKGEVPNNWEAPYTDDTQMMRAVLEGLLRSRPKPGDGSESAAREVAEEFIAWANSPENNRSPGASCMLGCHNLQNGRDWRVAGKPNGRGCGAAMRSMAYGVWFWTDMIAAADMAAMHARMTHLSKEASASAAAVAAATVAGIQNYPPEVMAQVAREQAERHDDGTAMMMGAAIKAARRGQDSRGVLDQLRGWTGAEAVAASLYCFLRHPEDYAKAVLLAVNSPGDSDSLGAITGALSGAHLGRSAIPEHWRARIEKSNELACYGSRVIRAQGCT